MGKWQGKLEVKWEGEVAAKEKEQRTTDENEKEKHHVHHLQRKDDGEDKDADRHYHTKATKGQRRKDSGRSKEGWSLLHILMTHSLQWFVKLWK